MRARRIDTLASTRMRAWLTALGAACLLGAVGASAASAATVAPGWSITALSEPTHFTPALNAECEAHLGTGNRAPCNRYLLLVTNVGGAPSSGPVTITDTLPAGLRAIVTEGTDEAKEDTSNGITIPCSGEHTVSCTEESSVAPFENVRVAIEVVVEAGAEPVLDDEASVSGGGAPTVTTSTQTQIGEQAAPLEFADASLQAWTSAGTLDTQAGDRPAAVTASFYLSNAYSEVGTELGFPIKLVSSAEDLRDVVVDLPAGLVGDPQALPRCPLTKLVIVERKALCPKGSEVGLITIREGGGYKSFFGPFSSTEKQVTPIYNIEPEGGYPAEFGFDYQGISVLMHAEVEGPPSYGLRVSIPGQDDVIQVNGATVTFFGDPAQQDDVGSPPVAFLTNPSDCAAGALNAKISVDTWQDPSRWLAKEMSSYPSLGGCEALSFEPSLSFQPETTQPDTPSGYEVKLTVPQAQNVSPYLATPPLRTATVTLPEGVAVSPAGAEGLVGCAAEGPEGFNAVGGQTGPEGQDLSDPYATELGEGHPGGDASPYDDGLYHTAPGHCPGASTLGTVRIKTPLLEEELTGHVYLAQPQCGGSGQPACSEAAAAEGKIFGIYIEASGSGAIIKLPGKVAANPQTGQLTATFEENPQLPFSELKLNFKAGARAPLSNPQTCGNYTTVSSLEPWSAPQTPTQVSRSSFEVSGCQGFPFSPTLSAGTTDDEGAASSPFTLTFGRKDGEQDLSSIAVSMPPGLLGEIAGIPRCGEAQANAGTCEAASQIGTTTVAAGSGSAPLHLTGRVYLTGPYDGQPFGLSFVVPAVAGPFNLGNVVVRASIAVNPETAALTVTSGTLPQIIDGVPTRLQSVNVDVDRPGFIINATNCEEQAIAASIGSAQGASAGVSTPYAASGCKNLPFTPGFTAETHAGHTRKDGDVLKVRVTSASGQANIGKVAVQLPEKLPSRLSTLELTCPEKQFAADPAGCDEGSVIGSAIAHTPVLASPLQGPVYFVSHAGAKFPELVAVLQGEGVTIELAGETFISKKGVTSSKFNAVPDAPISSFEMDLPTGPHSVLTGVGSLCKKALYMPTKITGQNGAVIEQKTKIKVAGCAAAKKKSAKKKDKGKGKRAGKRKDAKGKSHRGK